MKEEEEKRQAELEKERQEAEARRLEREAQLKEEQERREQEEKEQQVENLMFLRFLKLVIKTNAQLEQAKETLFSHRTFSLEDCFQLFDVNRNGKLGVEELSQVFGEHNIEIENLARIVELVDTDEDGTIDYREL